MEDDADRAGPPVGDSRCGREGCGAARPRLLRLGRLRERGGNGPRESRKAKQAFRPKPREREAGQRGVGRRVRGKKQARLVAREREKSFYFSFFSFISKSFSNYFKSNLNHFEF